MRKALSTPPHYDRAVVAGVRDLIRDGGERLAEVVHGTTVATNAVLERRRACTLVTTAGFRDVLESRRVRMPHLYDLFWKKPPPLVERELRLEVGERLSTSGGCSEPSKTRCARSRAGFASSTSSQSPFASCTRTAICSTRSAQARSFARSSPAST